ncbi:MAG: response regulator transcription factor [Myxococcota bacterium]|nr:response regulator transcription factor [Myxococcota bacterium]
MSEPAVILVVDDEASTRMLLQVTLGQQGYCCIQASTGTAGVAATIDQEPKVVLLDLGLPDLNGLEVTRRIRERSAVPIIVLSARGAEADKVAALDAGATDYVTKPFTNGELLARIRVALRSVSPTLLGPPSGTVTIGDLCVDFDLRRVTIAGVEVHLTPIEYRLLGVMILSPGRVVTHRNILRAVWGQRSAGQMNCLRVYMKKLRYKIEDEPARPKYLLNEPGIGYRFRTPC